MTNSPPSPDAFDDALGSDVLALLEAYRRTLDEPDHEPDESPELIAIRIAGTLVGRRAWIVSEGSRR